MFEQLVSFSLKNRARGALLHRARGHPGATCRFRELTVEAFPDPTDTQVNVITLFPGQPTEEVERRVSIPLERALNGTPGLARLRSLSLFGLSFVTLTFDDGVDALCARASRCSSACATPSCPRASRPSSARCATPIGEVYRYTLDGRERRPDEAAHAAGLGGAPAPAARARRRRRGQLRRPACGRSTSSRDPAQLAALGVDARRPRAGAAATARANASGGVLERGTEQFVIRSEGLFTTLDDIAQRARRPRTRARRSRAATCATVTRGLGAAPGRRHRGDDDDAVEGIVLMRRGENPSVVLERAARRRSSELNARAAAGRRADRRRSTTAPSWSNTTLETVFHNLLEGALLVTLVLFVFLLDLRASLIVARAHPAVAAGVVHLPARCAACARTCCRWARSTSASSSTARVVIVEHVSSRAAPARATSRAAPQRASSASRRPRARSRGRRCSRC